MKFALDNSKVPNGTVLIVGIRFEAEPGGDTRGRTNPKVYTYAMLKTGGLWYVTGSGKTPQAAGWVAVQRWLERDGRVVDHVELATTRTRIWPSPGPRGPAATSVTVDDPPGGRRRGTEWRTRTRTPEDDALGYHHDR